jgi:DNA helicase-2/ATP-dependent DNA helicase PcrA
MAEKPPTPEQSAVLASTAKITLVRACPGSGKTKTFVDIFQHILNAWRSNRFGIAALSFTNVAQEEIAKRVERRVGAPHFIGTLDSFLLRFVVRPFADTAGCTSKGVRLIPASLAANIAGQEVKVGPEQYQRASPLRVSFVGGTESNPTLAYYNPASYRSEVIPQALQPAVIQAKKSGWARHGRISHSDTHYLASCVLNGQHGDNIARLVARRFPVVLVDEFQDTGHFLGRALLSLLKAIPRTFVVGDPDQAIFEFSGTDPHLFETVEKLPGAQTFPMTTTQRCSKRVAAVSSHLSASNSTIRVRDGAPQGRAVLLVHTLKGGLLDAKTASSLRILSAGAPRTLLLARRKKTLLELQGLSDDGGFPGSSTLAKKLDSAAHYFRDGDPDNAARIVSKELGVLVLNDEFPTRRKVEASGITYSRWKRSLFSVLSQAAREPRGETWAEWLDGLKIVVESSVEELTGKPCSLGKNFHKKKLGNEIRVLVQQKSSAPPIPDGWAVSTIHQAKGTEAECVVFFAPQPKARTP